MVDLVIPPSPSLQIIRAHQKEDVITYFRRHRHQRITTLSQYRSPYIKALITAGKFEHNISALQKLSPLLQQYLDETVTEEQQPATVIVPIPLHPKRERERGYNQVAVIAKTATTRSSIRVVSLLGRVVHTSPQSHLGREERLSHLSGAFAYQERNIDWQQIRKVILLDDVVTTGSTLTTARAVLKLHLPRHITLVSVAIAH